MANDISANLYCIYFHNHVINCNVLGTEHKGLLLMEIMMFTLKMKQNVLASTVLIHEQDLMLCSKLLNARDRFTLVHERLEKLVVVTNY